MYVSLTGNRCIDDGCIALNLGVRKKREKNYGEETEV